MNQDKKIEDTNLSLQVSVAYVNYLVIKNGDNIYVSDKYKLEVQPISLAFFLDAYYSEVLTDHERACLYASMIDVNREKSGCDFNIGRTRYLKQSGIDTLNKLMSDYMEMSVSKQFTHAVQTYH